jgi:putative hydrolase of the HAD superfamily
METLFIDDTKENTDAAKALGIHIWNLKPGKEDVLELLTKNYI